MIERIGVRLDTAVCRRDAALRRPVGAARRPYRCAPVCASCKRLDRRGKVNRTVIPDHARRGAS